MKLWEFFKGNNILKARKAELKATIEEKQEELKELLSELSKIDDEGKRSIKSLNPGEKSCSNCSYFKAWRQCDTCDDNYSNWRPE